MPSAVLNDIRNRFNMIPRFKDCSCNSYTLSNFTETLRCLEKQCIISESRIPNDSRMSYSRLNAPQVPYDVR